jgi:hypothetical protein
MKRVTRTSGPRHPGASPHRVMKRVTRTRERVYYFRARMP